MRIGILGYGNLARSLEAEIQASEYAQLVGVFTRRNPDSLTTLGARAISISEIFSYKDEIDVLCLCQGSSSDLPKIAPELAEHFNTVDTYDNHGDAMAHKERMDFASRRGGRLALVSVGWDPGFLSLMRLYSYSFLPNPSVNTFWGRGVSQGHSEALRRIKGVKRAIQYTVPREDALTLAGLVCHRLSNTERHKRVCYIVAEEGKEDLITDEVLRMDSYFGGYETEIHFLSDSDFDSLGTLPSHRGRIFALGSSGRYKEVKHSLYLNLELGSNPDFTASVMLATARATCRMYSDGMVGAYSVFDVPPRYFAPNKCENVNEYL